MKNTNLYLIICFSFLISCQSKKSSMSVALEATQDSLIFPLSTNSSQFIKALFLFVDKEGKSYLTYQNNDEPEIYVYDIETQKLVKTIRYDKEGSNGIGPKAGGYFMKDWDEIYLPNLYTPEMSLIDSAGHKLRKIDFSELNADYSFIPTRSTTSNPFIYQDGKLYCSQLVNPRLGKNAVDDSPVEFVLELDKQRTEILSMRYPTTVTAKYGMPSLGIETKVSRCCNEGVFVYSFSFDENLYIADLEHKNVTKVKAKSAYIDKISLPESVPTEFDLAVRKMCEVPFYSSIIYDKYREVYYRFVYPETELGPNENFMDIWQLGRTKFSVMVLNKDLEVIGETLFPENVFASNLFFIREDGLYLSTSFIKNPNYSDDILAFKRIELVRE